MKTTPEALLVESGRLLYGSRWKAELASAIGVTRRTMAYWEKSAPKSKHRVWGDLKSLVAARARNLERLHASIHVAKE